MLRPPRRRAAGPAGAVCAFALAAVLSPPVVADGARQVVLSGSMGERALLVIDGQPRTVAPGATVQGVKLISLRDGEAQVEVDGRRVLLRAGTPMSVGAGAGTGNGGQIVLTATSGGHFVTAGAINGRATEFLVDTGATNVSIGQAEADRLGLAWRNGRRALAQTANGAVPVSQVTLDTVRVGEVVVYNVEATIMPAPMSYILLGNSFLTRFQMKRENDRMTLDRRP